MALCSIYSIVRLKIIEHGVFQMACLTMLLVADSYPLLSRLLIGLLVALWSFESLSSTYSLVRLACSAKSKIIWTAIAYSMVKHSRSFYHLPCSIIPSLVIEPAHSMPIYCPKRPHFDAAGSQHRIELPRRRFLLLLLKDSGCLNRTPFQELQPFAAVADQWAHFHTGIFLLARHRCACTL